MLFEDAEFAGRVARAKAKMAEIGVDVLLVASPANQFWLTGYDGWSFYTPQMVVVAADLEQPLWVGRAMDAVGAKFTVFMSHDHIVPYGDEYVGSGEHHPIEFLVEILKSRGWGAKRIGVEMDDYYYTARWHAILTAGLPDATFTDAFLAVNRARMKKSEREIEYLMQAGEIAGRAMQATFDAARPGVRQCDAIAELYRATTAGTPDHGGTFTCKPPNAMVGEYCSAPHLSWTDAPLSRCLWLGKPPQAMLDLSEIIAEGLNAVLDTVKPGVVLEELAAVWTSVISRHGIEKDSRIGYPVGIGYPPTWGELTCSMRKGDRTVMEPNMTFHCIPALWMEDYGLVISESFAVTETGAQTFADFPRKLFHLG
jgi:Xaa-Pro aminopeptidase